MTTICFYVNVSDEVPRRRVCLDVPDLRDPHPPRLPEPDPWAQLQILNTIDSLAARLQTGTGKDLQNVVREAIRNAATEFLGAEVTFSDRRDPSPSP